jgi:hypothetical protein
MYANRVQDRGNPFPRMVASFETQFALDRRVDPMVQIAKAIQPKRFGSFK